MSYTVLTEN